MYRLRIGMITAMCLMIISVAFGQKMSSQVFTVKGRVHSEIGQQLPANILVYKENDVAETINVNRNGKFKVKLDANAYYTLSFYMPMHQVKKIIVSTDGVDENHGLLDDTFECDVYLYDSYSLETVNKDLLDFPTAMLQFDADDRQLVVNRAYTSFMYEQEEKLMKDNTSEWVSDAAIRNK